MKFQTVAHNFFEAIRKGHILFDRFTLDFEEMLPIIQKALPEYKKLPIFVVREPANEVCDVSLVDIATQWVAESRIRLPYPAMLWQFRLTDVHDPADTARIPPDDIWIVYAHTYPDNPDVFAMTLFVTDVTDPHEWLNVPAVARIVPGKLQLLRYKMNNPPPDEPQRAEKDIRQLQDAAMFVCCSLVMMSSPAVELDAIKVPKDVNRGRKLMNRPQVPDHTVLRLPRVVYAKAGASRGGTHERPRCHWRRPHRREFRPGEFTDIPLTLVAKREGEPPPPPPVVELVARRKEPT